MQAEAGGESKKGMEMVVDGIRNGAHGYKEGKTVDSLVRLVAKTLEGKVRHPYRFWINLDRATDKRQLGLALRAIKNGKAKKVGAHWFF